MFMIAMLLVVVGGLNWGVQAFTGKDLVSRLVGKRAWIVYALVAVAALYIGFARDTYLPFLGETVMPCSLLKDQIPEGANTEAVVHVKPGAKILFWATEPATEDLKQIQDWRHAYLEYKNAGVTTADSNGVAVLRVRTPQAYTVGVLNHKKLSPHVHYRVCKSAGMLDRVETVFLGGEGFANEMREMAGSAEEERRRGMANLQAQVARREAFENPGNNADGHLVEDGVEERQEHEGFEDDEDEGFMNQYTRPVKLPAVKEPFAIENADAQFGPEFAIPMSIRDRKADVPLNAIAAQTERDRVVDANGIEEGPQHMGAELSRAY